MKFDKLGAYKYPRVFSILFSYSKNKVTLNLQFMKELSELHKLLFYLEKMEQEKLLSSKC